MAITNPRTILLAILKIPNGANSTTDYTPVNQAEAKFISSVDAAGFSSIGIINVDGALTGTVTLRALGVPTADETNEASYFAIQSPPGTDITIPAGKAIAMTDKPFLSMILFSSANEGAERTFYVYGEREQR